ncbi:MAG: serine/threonine protein phosphatase, partial [Lachnospiraceae bacterium]|nr:serine/threonine protein phosphatase [Lachnospiraceae bacterium]
DAKWRIVTIHQDIYGSGLDHSNTDGMILRTQLTPLFDENDIDVVLQGHDHTYSRTKMLEGDGQEHGKYEFRLDDSGKDYDWDHAYNVDTDEAIKLDTSDATDDEKAAKEKFDEDNNCYTIEDVDGNSVNNPTGILYMTANSASGSKYYELAETQQDYVEVRSQNWLPSYSVISLSDSAFTIDTYQIKDDGSVEAIDDTFTINKTADSAASSTEASSTEAK